MSDEGSLNVLLAEILDDLQTTLEVARNVPAKRMLRDRVDRVKRAIAQNEAIVVIQQRDQEAAGPGR
jgi:hypothetical protein